MRILLTAAAAALGALTLTACGQDCKPEDDITVSMDQDSELVRTVPSIASGKVNLLGTDVPDAHGEFKVNLRILNAPNVIIDKLTLEQTVNGAAKDVELLRTRYNDADFNLTDEAPNQGKFTFDWRMKHLGDYLLEEGKSYVSKVTANWRYAGCRTQTGVATVDVNGTVKSPNTVKNFNLASAEAGRINVLSGPMAKMTLTSRVTNEPVQVADVKYQVVFFDEGEPPELGFGTADLSKTAIQVNGAAQRQVTPADTVAIYTSSNRSVNGAPYDNAGQAASTATLVGGGKAVVTLEVQSTKLSSSLPATDVITTLVDVP